MYVVFFANFLKIFKIFKISKFSKFQNFKISNFWDFIFSYLDIFIINILTFTNFVMEKPNYIWKPTKDSLLKNAPDKEDFA